jgi:thiol-disulfide isomerase/thioredoxin
VPLVSAKGQGLAALVAVAAAAGCAHVPSLADIHTQGYALPSVDGPPLALDGLRGKVVILTFFATWCFPCVAEVEPLKHLAARHPKDLQIVSVGMDLEGTLVLKPFRDAMAISYPVLVADAATRQGTSPFGPIQQLPSTFVLDGEGRVQAAFAGVADEALLEQMVQRLLP